jgi:SHS2 domain-containing protein
VYYYTNLKPKNKVRKKTGITMITDGKKFEILAHTADVGLRAYGRTKEELFINALRGMFTISEPRYLVTSAQKTDAIVCANSPVHRTVSLCSPDEQALLIDFLSHALYLSDRYNEAYGDAMVHKLINCCISATICGFPIDGFAAAEIKAVTYHDLALFYESGMWQATIVFDI